MRFAFALAATIAATSASADEPQSIASVLSIIDRVAVTDTGGIGVLSSDGPIYFRTSDGRRFRIETAVPTADLERMEQCDMWQDGCPAEISGILRVQDDYFQVLVEAVRFLE